LKEVIHLVDNDEIETPDSRRKKKKNKRVICLPKIKKGESKWP